MAFSAAITAHIRDIDTVGRLGGDEFGLLLPDSGLEQGLVAVDRVRAAIAGRPLDAAGHAVPMTMSAGLAAVGVVEDSVDAALARADRALYEAKRRGRNQVVAADDA